MNAINTLAALVYFLNRADAAAASVNCVDARLRRDSTCNGSLTNPCDAKIVGVDVGTVLELAYDQQIPNGPCNPSGANGDCEVYAHKIYVEVTGAPVVATADVELSQFGMMALCNEPCLGTSGGDFTGLCQVPKKLAIDNLGCQFPANATNVCASNVLLLGNTTATDLPTKGRCEPVGAPAGTLACSIYDPCEVKVLGGTVGDILKITYTQPISDGAEHNYGAYCKGIGAASCEQYTGVMHAVVVAGEPVTSQVELDRNGLEQICKGACLDTAGGVFAGVCQYISVIAPETECKEPAATTDEICGVNLVGTFEYEKVGALTTEAPTTSGAEIVMVGLALMSLLMTTA